MKKILLAVLALAMIVPLTGCDLLDPDRESPPTFQVELKILDDSVPDHLRERDIEAYPHEVIDSNHILKGEVNVGFEWYTDNNIGSSPLDFLPGDSTYTGEILKKEGYYELRTSSYDYQRSTFLWFMQDGTSSDWSMPTAVWVLFIVIIGGGAYYGFKHYGVGGKD